MTVTILITGHRGYIGSVLYRRMLDIPEINNVIGYDLVEGNDILDYGRLLDFMRKTKPDIVIHLADISSSIACNADPILAIKVNACGTVNILNAMHEVGCLHIIYASAAAVYGKSKKMPYVETLNVTPDSAYGISKLLGEYAIYNHYDLKGNEGNYLILRLFNVVGTSGFRDVDSKMIKKLGDRLQHLNFTLSVIDSESDNSSSININRGILYIGSTNPVPMATKRIFQALSTTGSLRGLITDAKITYNLDEVVAIPELTIIPQASTEDDPIDEYYIEELISKAVNVNIVYTRETIHERYRYSDMIYRGSMSDLKKINVIIPADHAERHIDWNVDLEEIHILVESVADVDNVKYVLEKYQDSDIFYHIHYARTDENEYWKILKNMGDVVFQDIVVTLLPLKI